MNKMTALMAAALTFAAAAPLSAIAGNTGEPSTMDKVSANTKDAATTTKIKTKLAADRNLSATDIHVETTAGVVTLSGNVDNEAQIALAEKTVKEIKGVSSVHNELAVKGAD